MQVVGQTPKMLKYSAYTPASTPTNTPAYQLMPGRGLLIVAALMVLTSPPQV